MSSSETGVSRRPACGRRSGRASRRWTCRRRARRRLGGGLEHVTRAVDVALYIGARVRHPQPVVRGHVKERAAARAAARSDARSRRSPSAISTSSPSRLRGSLLSAHERAHALPVGEQRAHDGGARRIPFAPVTRFVRRAHAGDADGARAPRSFSHAGSAISVNARPMTEPEREQPAHARRAEVRGERELAEGRDVVSALTTTARVVLVSSSCRPCPSDAGARCACRCRRRSRPAAAAR